MLHKLMKRIIGKGNFDAAEMQKKLDVYLAYDRISQEEYEELCTMIQAVK